MVLTLQRVKDMNLGRPPRGFSLIETLVATTLVVTAVGALAQIAVLASRENQRAGVVTAAVLLAESKAEELLATPWEQLGRSDRGAIDVNVEGFYDLVDQAGRQVARQRAQTPGAIYVRRWSIEQLPESPEDAVVIQVMAAAGAGSGSADRRARIVTVRRRPDWWVASP